MSTAEVEIFGVVADSDEEIEAMRRMRNAGRKFMTGDQTEITVEQQKAWWRSHKLLIGPNFLPIIYRRRDDAEIVGYGILSRRDEGLCVSLAVAPVHRGYGYGTSIYSDLRERAGEPVRALILDGNHASLSAARKAGYVIAGKFSNLLFLVKE